MTRCTTCRHALWITPDGGTSCHNCATDLVPGGERTADATRRVPTRVTTAAPSQTGRDGRGCGPTPAVMPYDGAATRRLVAQSLMLTEDATARHEMYAVRRVPNSPRFC